MTRSVSVALAVVGSGVVSVSDDVNLLGGLHSACNLPDLGRLAISSSQYPVHSYGCFDRLGQQAVLAAVHSSFV